MKQRRKEGNSVQVEGPEEISLAQPPKEVGEILVCLAYLQLVSKANSEMNLRCSQAWKSSCCPIWGGYRYETEFIFRKNLKAEKHDTSLPGVSLFPTKVLRPGMVELDATQKGLQSMDPTPSCSSCR